MDYIYAKLNNHLVNVNRIEYIRLNRAPDDNDPIEGLVKGDYFLETKILNDDRLIYTDLSDINKGEEKLSQTLESESQRVDSMINQLNQNIAVIVDTLNRNITDAINTINGAIATEILERKEGDEELREDLDKESRRVNSMIDQLNSNIKVIVDQLNSNIAIIVGQINAALLNEMDERKNQDTLLEQAIGDERERAISKEDELSDSINAEIEARLGRDNELTELINTLSSSLSTDTAALNARLDKEIADRESAISTLSTTIGKSIGDLTTSFNSYVSQTDDRLNTISQTISTVSTTLTEQLNTEREARIESDGDLSTRIGNLEGKTTRLFYGEGTISSPIASDIQTFIDGLDTDPKYEAPYSGIAVVVYLTDENTYHIWHYYINLGVWRDDGIDTVSTFTNDTKGIIQGTTSVGYISAENGFGKVNGWDDIVDTIGSNYASLTNTISALTESVYGEGGTVNVLTASISALQGELTDKYNTLTTSINDLNVSLLSTISETEASLISSISAIQDNLNDYMEETDAQLGNINGEMDTWSTTLSSHGNRITAVESNLDSHTTDTSNPHNVTIGQVNPRSLTISLNGQVGVTYNATSDQSLNITAPLIGAATTSQGALAESALQPAEIQTGTESGTILVRGTGISVAGLGSAAYEDVSEFATLSSVLTLSEKVTDIENDITGLSTTLQAVSGVASQALQTASLANQGIAETNNIVEGLSSTVSSLNDGLSTLSETIGNIDTTSNSLATLNFSYID